MEDSAANATAAPGGAAVAGRPAIACRGITKRFPGVLANSEVDFEAAEGEVHALLGENGAGKSTLSNILTGLYRADEGELELYGQPVAFHAPRDALDAGICMVHQHFRLVETFTVTENVVLGDHRDIGRSFRIQPRAVERRVAELGARYGLAVDPRARIWQLSVGEQQRVEILKALYREARILILDEPTAVLTPQEADTLFETLRAMAAEGRTIVFISHKLHEVKAVADRVTVLRGGRVVATVAAADATPRSLAALMVGREVDTSRRVAHDRQVGAPVLEHAARLIQRYDVRGGGPDLPARQLSGGNLQKVVLAREFSGQPRVLVAASPTRGLDVAAIETVHRYLREAAAEGVGILLISEDL